ncbi:CHAP domain-containing protein [Treponema bryantii]|uniref:CHAP domain-containing protein n=1 Tax=Treponema bryantii TaxID=163 RepID=A0A1H9ASA8_9SPIR|nr:CHAP domain-containing protein [Treponema bryantii]SEP79415.1 CHAP domain-containing protein [Treponema bryantii]
MTLTTFINTYLGKKVDYKDKDFKGDGSFQCVDLARQYIHDVYGVEQFPALGADGGAKDIFDKCTNLNVTVDSALADYSRGDILIWNSSKTNKYGHVAILIAIYNTKYFIVLEQDGFKQDGVKFAFRSRENLRGCLWK